MSLVLKGRKIDTHIFCPSEHEHISSEFLKLIQNVPLLYIIQIHPELAESSDIQPTEIKVCEGISL